MTVEEELLAALLHANTDLTEALREYDELISLGTAEREEREVKERSRKETRLDRTVRSRQVPSTMGMSDLKSVGINLKSKSSITLQMVLS